MAAAKRARRASSSSTSRGLAPFCGAYTRAAPASPSSGLSTSQATLSSMPARRARAGARSTRASSMTAPSARSIPAPPSVVALPPNVSTTRRAPAAMASATSSPTPAEVAVRGARAVQWARATASADSTIAVVPSADSSHFASSGAPFGPDTRADRQRHDASSAASTSNVPSPPSAMGHCSACVGGGPRRPQRQRFRRLSARKRTLELVWSHQNCWRACDYAGIFHGTGVRRGCALDP